MKKWIFALVFLLVGTACAEKMVSIDAEGSHVLALDENGIVWAWGSNQRGESVPQRQDARVLQPEKVLENAVNVVCGQQFSLALTENGDLYGWGDNRQRQIPNCEAECAKEPVEIFKNVLTADACDDRGILVTKSGEVYTWGRNEAFSMLTDSAKDARAGTSFFLILKENGDVYFVGEADFSPTSNEITTPILILSGASEIAAGEQSMLAVCGNDVYAWGASAADGRLFSTWNGIFTQPQKTELPKGKPLAGLTMNGCIDETASLWLSGAVYSYSVYYDENGSELAALNEGILIPYGETPVCLYGNVLDAALGDAFVIVLLKDGSLLAWGSNDQGQIADGEYTALALDESDDDEDAVDVTILYNDQFIFPYWIF